MGGFRGRTPGNQDSGFQGAGKVERVVCGGLVLAAAVAQLLLQRVLFSPERNAFDINTSVHSFHLSCVIEVLGFWFLVLVPWVLFALSVPGSGQTVCGS